MICLRIWISLHAALILGLPIISPPARAAAGDGELPEI